MIPPKIRQVLIHAFTDDGYLFSSDAVWDGKPFAASEFLTGEGKFCKMNDPRMKYISFRGLFPYGISKAYDVIYNHHEHRVWENMMRDELEELATGKWWIREGTTESVVKLLRINE